MSVQQELPDNMVVAVTYLGSRGRNLPVARAINNIPMEFLSTSRTRDVANEALLSQQRAQSRSRAIPGMGSVNTVQRSQLMRPYPQFGTISIEKYDGTDEYNAVSLQFDKRFKGGNSLTVQYTRSHLRDKLNYLNPADNILEDRVSPNDRPNRLSIGTSLQLPFGRDGHWGKDFERLCRGAPRRLAIERHLSVPVRLPADLGQPLLGLVLRRSVEPQVLHRQGGCRRHGRTRRARLGHVNCFYFHDAPVQTNGVDDIVKQRADPRINMATANNVRYFPSTLPGVRTHQLHLFDFGIGK